MKDAQELAERYVAAVRRHLADTKETADIAAELGEAVRSKIDAKEAELGRPLDKAEAVAVVKTFGSPMLAAARYRGQEYLIGPTLYPYFWPTARIVVGIVAAVAIVGALVPAVLNDRPMGMMLRGLGFAWNGALWSFGAVVVIFIVMEQTRSGAKIEAAWRPDSLPRNTRGKPKSLFESVFSLAVDAVIIAWWVGLLPFPDNSRTLGDEAISVSFSAAWQSLYWPVLAMMGISAAVHFADVFHPTWSRLRSAAQAAADVIGLYAIWMLANGGQLITVTGTSVRVGQVQGGVGAAVQVSIYVAAIAFAIALVIELWRVVRSFRLKAPPAGLAV